MRVLIIEDDPEVARLLRMEMQFNGWQTEEALTGADGLAKALSQRFDALVLDRMLPDMDGVTLCRTLRAHSDVPVLMLTARGDLSERVEGLDAGADDYLVKPFATEELFARLRALRRRALTHEPKGDALLATDGISLDPQRHEVLVLGQPVALTRREFDLLHLLLKNEGIVLTRDMILERVWGWNYLGSSNIVDVYVGYLRQKLAQHGVAGVIQTVRGVGYVLRSGKAQGPEP
jgi:DNA-binding response OmpR family regulator